MTSRKNPMLTHKKLDRSLGFIWIVALVGYFGPWISHQAAALAWNAYDLFNLARLLPPVETGQLAVNVQALRLPLIGLAVLAPMLLARAPAWQRWTAAVFGGLLALSTLPPYPQILEAWRTPGWRVLFWWSVGAVGGIGLSALVAPRLGALRSWLMVAGVALTGIPAFVTYERLRPTIRALYAAPVRAGWGYWLCGLGLLLLAGVAWLEGLSPPQERL